ncbi:ATP-binding protein [Terrabacter sp. MAHUQ-38]|uniref:ATP-binding protein n=1 Tax=unclassified Terrabacter TaxID=2630222 RepID=UPI00165E7EE6|nr:response regulator [Terrabacter sp. MAHUQ-38]
MRRSEWRLFRAAAIGCAVVALALAGFVLSGIGGQDATRATTDAAFVVFSAFAAFACFRAARLRQPGRRLPWRLLGGAASCYALGNTIWFYYQVLAPDQQTYPGPADIFFVAVVPFAVAAMLTLPSRDLSAAARARAIADGLIIGAALLFISWIVLVGPLFEQLGEVSWLYLAVYVYYPLTDIVIISIAGGLAIRAAGRERVPILLVAVGFVSIACADTGIGYLALQGKEAAGSGFDLGWTIGYMLLGLAALAPQGEGDVSDDRVDPRAPVRELLPYVPVGVMLAVVASSPSLLADDVPVRLLVAVVALLAFRHLLTLADNIRLTGGLEDLVRERTQALEQLTHRHSSILDGAGEGIVGLDERGRLTFVNPAAAALLGRSSDDLTGRSFHEVTQPRNGDGEPVPALLDPVGRALLDGQVRSVADGTYQRADGTDFSVELTVAPTRSAGDVTGAVLMFRDVTERREVDRMKDEFVSVVSHELRTPLTSLRGALGLLEGGLLKDAAPRAQRMVQIAVESTDRLIRLINDILDVERLAAGKLALHRQAWSATDLVARAVGEMTGLASQAQVRLEVGETQGMVDADADRIVQTLTNLLSNAVKFSPADGTVRVSAVGQGNEVLVTVTDEGDGIPPEHLEAVFGRFAQVDASDTREKEGSGLGLAICRGIVEQHGGRIWAESEPGAGATFCFTLPVVEVSVALETPLETPLETLPDGDEAVRPVLVCEDDPATRAVITELLRSHGYRVVGAGSAEEAMTLAFRQTPAAVLMDLTLPGQDGWTAIAALRADPRTRDVPVVIISGTEPGPTPEGVEAWLTKPLDVAWLLAELNVAIGDAGGKPCVLIVEDDPALTGVMVSLFAEHGVTAVPAHTARDARRLSHDTAPDLVMLDLLLPDGDGFDLVDWLRADPRLRRVPLVVYSALDLDEHDKQRLRLGPTEFYTKTRTNPAEVERQVLKLLDTVVTGAAR